MSWNYRVVRRTFQIPTHEGENEEVLYGIHEVYYNDNGEIWTLTEEPVEVISETAEHMAEVLSMMKRALELPVLDYDELVANNVWIPPSSEISELQSAAETGDIELRGFTPEENSLHERLGAE